MQGFYLVSVILVGVSNSKTTGNYVVLTGCSYNQMTGNLVSQASTMNLGSTPNDIVSKLNPLFIVILIPIMDFIIYPGLVKMGIRLSPIKKITTGFALSSLAMVCACVIQHYIYTMSPCGYNINKLSKTRKDCNADISVWVQALPYGLIGMSEIMASITKLEYAYTKVSFQQALVVLRTAN